MGLDLSTHARAPQSRCPFPTQSFLIHPLTTRLSIQTSDQVASVQTFSKYNHLGRLCSSFFSFPFLTMLLGLQDLSCPDQ